MRFILFFMLLPLASYCQNELPTKDGKVIYEVIDSTVTAPADIIYTKAKLWFVDAFKNAKEVIQLDDKENRTIIGKGLFQFSQGIISYVCKFTIKIVAKDNKYRAQFYDVIVESGTARVPYSAEWYNERKGYQKVKDHINESMNEIITELKTSLAKKMDNDF